MTDQLHEDLARALEDMLAVTVNMDLASAGFMDMDAIQQRTRDALSRYREAKEGEGQYRPLEEGESIEPGDEYKETHDTWRPYDVFGVRFCEDIHFASRRPIRKEQRC